MLRSMGFETVEEMQSAMKEYEEYCRLAEQNHEAIPSLMQYLGRPNSGSDFFAQIQRETADQVFSSKEELETAVSHIVERESTKSLDDFHGLSPRQMHNIITHRTFPENELFSLNPRLPADEVEQTLALKYAAALLTLLEQEGGTLPLTPKGNLKRVHTTTIMATLVDLDTEHYYIRSEDDVPPITQAKHLLYFAGYINLLKTRMHLSAKGEQWLGSRDPGELYRDLLFVCADDYEWLDEDLFPPEYSIMQDSLPFSLLLLKESRHRPRTAAEYLKEFTRAFPMVIPKNSGAYGPIMLEVAYQILLLNRFCHFFGLVEGASRSPAGDTIDSGYVTTKLFERVFNWKR